MMFYISNILHIFVEITLYTVGNVRSLTYNGLNTLYIYSIMLILCYAKYMIPFIISNVYLCLNK